MNLKKIFGYCAGVGTASTTIGGCYHWQAMRAKTRYDQWSTTAKTIKTAQTALAPYDLPCGGNLLRKGTSLRADHLICVKSAKESAKNAALKYAHIAGFYAPHLWRWISRVAMEKRLNS